MRLLGPSYRNRSSLLAWPLANWRAPSALAATCHWRVARETSRVVFWPKHTDGVTALGCHRTEPSTTNWLSSSEDRPRGVEVRRDGVPCVKFPSDFGKQYEHGSGSILVSRPCKGLVASLLQFSSPPDGSAAKEQKGASVAAHFARCYSHYLCYLCEKELPSSKLQSFFVDALYSFRPIRIRCIGIGMSHSSSELSAFAKRR